MRILGFMLALSLGAATEDVGEDVGSAPLLLCPEIGPEAPSSMWHSAQKCRCPEQPATCSLVWPHGVHASSLITSRTA